MKRRSWKSSKSSRIQLVKMIVRALTRVLPDTNPRITVTSRKAQISQEADKIRVTNPYVKLEIAANNLLVDQELNREVLEAVLIQMVNL